MGSRAGAGSVAGPGSGSTRLPTVTAVTSGFTRTRGPIGSTERGAVTAEAAVVIPLLLAVAMALVWLVALAVTQVRVVDAAREVARAAARGEDDATAVEAGRRVAPEGAEFDVSREGGTVRVQVAARVRGPGGLLGFLPAVPVDSEAFAVEEPAAAGGAG